MSGGPQIPDRDAPVTVPAHLSYSQASTLSECSGRYYLEKGARVPSRPIWASVGGTAAHTLTEILDRKLYDEGEHISDLSVIEEMFYAEFKTATANEEARSGFEAAEFTTTGRATKEFPDKEGPLWWAAKGPGFVKSWVTFRDMVPYTIPSFDVVDPETGEVSPTLAIELKFDFAVPGLPPEVTVVGSIDRVLHRTLEDGSDEYVVVDLKFGSRDPLGEDQLVTYRTGLVHGWGVDPRWGYYWMGRKAQTTQPVDLQSSPIEALHHDYVVAHEQRMAGHFRYKRSNLCGSCGVRDYCPKVGGKYAGTIRQPWEISEPVSLRLPTPRV